jgi:hypothetical protein
MEKKVYRGVTKRKHRYWNINNKSVASHSYQSLVRSLLCMRACVNRRPRSMIHLRIVSYIKDTDIRALNKARRHKRIWENGSVPQCIPNLGTKWRWVVSFTPRPLHPRGKGPYCSLVRRLGSPPSRCGSFGEEADSLHLSRIELRYLWYQTSSIVTIVTERYIPPPPHISYEQPCVWYGKATGLPQTHIVTLCYSSCTRLLNATSEAVVSPLPRTSHFQHVQHWKLNTVFVF